MEPESSQETITEPYTKPVKSSTPHLPNTHLNKGPDIHTHQN
jgi:hypothetical protein